MQQLLKLRLLPFLQLEQCAQIPSVASAPASVTVLAVATKVEAPAVSATGTVPYLDLS
jgi:hypothetical protein